MKLLIVSHPCVTPINQQFYAEVEKHIGWRLTILTPSNWKNDYSRQLSPQRWSEYNGQLLSIPVWRSGSIPLHIYRSVFIPLLKHVNPDAIYVHHEAHAIATAQVYLANSLSICRPIGFYSAQNILKSYPMPFRQMERMVFQKSSYAFPVSQSVAQNLRQKKFAGELSILPLGVDPNIYYPHIQARQIAASLKKAKDEILVGYLGRITEEKGLKTLLHALKLIDDLPWRFIVIGSGTYEEEFDTIAKTLGLDSKITRLGYVSHTEVPKYLTAFDLLVLPSETRPNWKEQFGRVIIEALACGTPVVGSDSGEIPYLVKATGGGLIFPEGQSRVLADQLQKILLNPSLRLHLAKEGQRSVSEHYTNRALAMQFAQVIDQAVKIKKAAL